MPDLWLVFEATPRCNLECVFCYNVWLGKHSKPSELSLDDIEELFKRIRDDAHPTGVTITGGEPLLRADLPRMAETLRNLALKVGLTTNGTLLDSKAARRLVSAGISHFEVSLPAATAETYTRLCGDNRLRRARDAIVAIADTAVPASASIMVCRPNLEETGRAIELAFALGARAAALNRFVPTGRGRKNAAQLSLSTEHLEKMLKQADSVAGRTGMAVYTGIPVEDCIVPHRQYPHVSFGPCHCGREKWAVDPSGNLRTCEQSPVILGNLMENSFTELSESHPARRFRQNNLKPDCLACESYPSCGGACRLLPPGRS
ncbi:radical SAM protein [Candidatus Fermentibacteria bacterium]|nr:radical SAM protein [Candidatus Fermentibacteria bacterium]